MVTTKDNPGPSSAVGGFINRMTKTSDEGAYHASSLLHTIWAWIVVHFIAFKFNTIELLTRHRTVDPQAVGKRDGDVAVVTGGTRGIGSEVVKKLMQCNVHVIIGARNVSSGAALIEKIRAEGVTTGSAEALELDLMSLQSVNKFAKQVLKKTDKVNLLINNAGIMFVDYTETVDGFESHFQVNYLSHFLLTQLLHEALVRGASKSGRNSRIVNVSSCASFGGDVNFADLQLKRNYSKFNAYMVTKFMQVIFSQTADRKYREEGVPIHSYSLHPGVVKTELYDGVAWLQLFSCILPYMFKSPAEGADTVCYAALSPEIENEGGLFLANSQSIPPNPKANEQQKQNQLWDITKELLDAKLGNTA